MKIVIDIPKKTYDAIKERNIITCGETFAHKLVNCIKNGTPLPKGHGDLKDADIYKTEVKKYIAENKNSDDLYLAGCGDGAYHALHIYDCIPTIIEADGDSGVD